MTTAFLGLADRIFAVRTQDDGAGSAGLAGAPLTSGTTREGATHIRDDPQGRREVGAPASCAYFRRAFFFSGATRLSSSYR